MAALSAVRDLGLQSSCIGAGAIRSMVWDQLHGYELSSPLADVDVVYFDIESKAEQDSNFERLLQIAIPGVSWEVTNQANIHHWFLAQYSQVVSPLTSLMEGIATWPEYATCVGVALCHDDDIEILAPYGLTDLYSMVLRHNPIRATKEMYMQRVIQKRLVERWPLVSVCTD
jgi:hypothetical protein